MCPGKSFGFPMPQLPLLQNRADSPPLLPRGTARLSSLVLAKLLGNPLTEVAAQHEHAVVAFWSGGFMVGFF